MKVWLFFNERSDDDAIDQGPLKESADNLTYEKDFSMLLDSKTECEIRNEEWNQQLERLWKTDFENTEVETKVCAPVEDKRAFKIMEGILQQVHGHFQVTLPWQHDLPYKLNNKVMAERRALFLKRCLMKDEELSRK